MSQSYLIGRSFHFVQNLWSASCISFNNFYTILIVWGRIDFYPHTLEQTFLLFENLRWSDKSREVIQIQGAWTISSSWPTLRMPINRTFLWGWMLRAQYIHYSYHRYASRKNDARYWALFGSFNDFCLCEKLARLLKIKSAQ